MTSSDSLSADQLQEAQAICDEICERLETADQYTYDLRGRRGRPGNFGDQVWNESIRWLQAVGYEVSQTGL